MTDRQFEIRIIVVVRVFDGDLLGIRNVTHQLAQPKGGILGAHVTHFGWRQLDDGYHTVTARTGVPVLDQLAFARSTLVDLINEILLGLLQLRQDFQGTAVRRAFGQISR